MNETNTVEEWDERDEENMQILVKGIPDPVLVRSLKGLYECKRKTGKSRKQTTDEIAAHFRRHE